MTKSKLIILEGAQGSGKGTISTMLRENIPCTTLMRLSGIKDKSKKTGLSKVFNLRLQELQFLLNTYGCETTYILDRSFMSEKVYCNLGFKEYDFQKEYDILKKFLNFIGQYYDVHFIVLSVDESEFTNRLKRNKAEYEHAKFSVESSIDQQKEYIKELLALNDYCENVNCHIVNNNKTPQEVYNDVLGRIGL